MSEIKVVPCPQCASENKEAYKVLVDGEMIPVCEKFGPRWCGTEAEALEKAQQLRKVQEGSDRPSESKSEQADAFTTAQQEREIAPEQVSIEGNSLSLSNQKRVSAMRGEKFDYIVARQKLSESQSAARPVETLPPAPTIQVSHEQNYETVNAKGYAEQAAPPRPLTCGKPAGSLHPRLGLFYGCVLTEGHDGDHKPGGNCFAHGKYVGLQCPQWPKCAEEVYAKGKEILAAPAAIEQARPQPPDKYELLTREILTIRHAVGKAIPLLSEITPKSAAAEPAPERTPPQDFTVVIGHGEINVRFPEDWNPHDAAQYIAKAIDAYAARAVAVPEPAAQQESVGMLQFFGFEIKEATSYVQVYPFTGPHIFRKGERERMATEEENFMWLALKKFWSDSEDENRQAEPAPTPSREPLLRLSLEHAKQIGFTPDPEATEVMVYGVTKWTAEASALGD